MEEGEPIESGMVSRAIERAQKQVEARNFEIRKHLLEYDDVMNKQREAIYQLRRDILEGKEGRDYVIGIANEVVSSLVDPHCPALDPARGRAAQAASGQGRIAWRDRQRTGQQRLQICLCPRLRWRDQGQVLPVRRQALPALRRG